MAKTEGTPTLGATEMQSWRGKAPWREALHRVVHNRLAMIGLVLVSAIVLPVIFAPWVTPFSPSYQYWWIGAQPPGTSHPDVLGENLLVTGEQAQLPKAARQAEHIVITALEAAREEFRLVVRRGRLAQIQRTEGAEFMTELDLSAERWIVREIRPNGEKVDLIVAEDEPLQLNAQAPAFFEGSGSRVLIVERQLREANDRVIYEARLVDGLVMEVRRAGEVVPRAAIRAPAIASIEADGELLMRRHLLGTDQLGRDVLACVLYGGRISLLVGIVGTLVSLLIGVIYGACSGYMGGRTDQTMMSAVDILYAVPFMFLVIILMVYFDKSIIMLFVALGAVQWLTMARIVRGQVLSLKQKEFIPAARMSGARPLTIIFRHLIPNTLGPVVVYTTLTVPIVILQESFLAFLGLSVTFQGRDLESWGALIHQGMQFMKTDGRHNWMLLAPSVAMVMALLGMNCLGDGLRDVLDPRLETR